MKKNLLVVGDSFSADWSQLYKNCSGWVNKLEPFYEITNLSEAGAGEYKIMLQLKSVDVGLYDKLIICHTSPFRIYIKQHPIHSNDVLHYNCDLIYKDILEHKENFICNTAINFFEQIYDIEYANVVHQLMVKELQATYPNAIHISFFDLNISNVYYFYNEFKNYKGNINHLNERGNEIIYNKMLQLLENS